MPELRVVLLWLLVGCGGASEDVCRLRCPTAAGETCEACYANIATCCYGDDPVQIFRLAQARPVCEADPGCVACCDECAALSCQDLIANNNCPAALVGR